MTPKVTRLPNISKAVGGNGNISSTPTTGISAPIRPANIVVQAGGTSGERLVEIPRWYYVASQVDLTHIDAGSYNLLRMLYLISASRNLPISLPDKPPALLPCLRTPVHQYVQPAIRYAPLSSRQ